MDLGAALLAVFTALVVKGAVMALSTVVLVRVYKTARAPAPRRLWQLVPSDGRSDTRLLFWALACFAASELTCGVEIYVVARSSAWLEGFHGAVSATGMALFALGTWRFLDGKVVRFGEAGCALHRVCRTCTVREPVGCKMRHTWMIVGTLVVLAAILPLCASTARMDADLHRFALPFPALNHWWDARVVPWLARHFSSYSATGSAFFYPSSILVLEFRVVPIAAALVAGWGVFALARHRLGAGTSGVILGAGALAYSYFELLLYRGTGDLLLGSLGHEVGELWFLFFTVEFLRRCYPREEPGAPRPEAVR